MSINSRDIEMFNDNEGQELDYLERDEMDEYSEGEDMLYNKDEFNLGRNNYSD